MKKNLLTIGFLAWTFSLGAQTILCHVDANATMYVGKNALVYNGGGLQLKDNAVFENHGNVMVSGNGTTDVVKTVGATVTGSVPADDMKKICSIYDNGITFWKNGSEVGQYNLDNTV